MVYGYMSSATGNIIQINWQCQIIKLYCKEEGYNLHSCFWDEGSGLDTRESLQSLLDELKDGDIVVVKDYSRLTRNMSKLYEVINIIKDKGAELKIIDQNIEDADVFLPDDRIKEITQRVLKNLK